jgi:hypothetical protein
MYRAIAKLTLKFIALGVLTGSLLFYSGYSSSQNAKPPRIVVAAQPDSPLRVLSTYVDATDPLRPQYGYSVTNISDKPIRAYTIQESISMGPGPSVIGTTMTHSPAVKLFLKPYETQHEEGGLGSVYQEPPVEIELAVDFVEFADGTRWGEDKGRTAERIDGMRAGGKAAIKKFRELLANEGVERFEQALENPNLIEPQKQPKPSYWADGFKTGVNIVKSRLRAAKTKGGQSEIKRELDKPFDSTEGRQEP